MKDIITENPIEVLCIDETKMSYDYTDAQFLIDGYQFPPFRRDRPMKNFRSHGGGKMVFIKDGIINNRLLKYETPTAETICVEITISNRKWFIMFAYSLKVST